MKNDGLYGGNEKSNPEILQEISNKLSQIIYLLSPTPTVGTTPPMYYPPGVRNLDTDVPMLNEGN